MVEDKIPCPMCGGEGKIKKAFRPLPNHVVVRKVWQNKASGQLLVTIPKHSEIKEGEYVKVEKTEYYE
ncbi:MAG: hypothetical protein ACE5KE_00665 [Methanosarcinales archaeon]